MDDAGLEKLLLLRGQSPVPPAPANLAQNVWREIRRKRAAEERSWLSWFVEPFCRPSLVAPALALALMFGVGLGVEAVPAEPNPMRSALDLQVFSPAPPALPSTLLHATL